MSAFCNVEAVCRECFPILWIACEKLACERSRYNHQPRSRFSHEINGAFPVQWCEKTLQARPKIPNQARFVVIDSRKLHFRAQRITRFLEERVSGKRSRN